jgi:hypothetical protein
METITTMEDMKTLATCINKLVLDGFTEDYKVTEEGELTSLKDNRTYPPNQVHVVNFFRFEGASDPADNSILYAIETDDGKKGTLTDAYGPYADHHVTKFLKQVEDISKKPMEDDTAENG